MPTVKTFSFANQVPSIQALLLIVSFFVCGASNAQISTTTPPAAALSPPTGLHFYNQVVQRPSTPEYVTLKNTAATSMTIKSVATSLDFPFTTGCVGSGGTGTLAAGASCTISVEFVPQTTGARTASLTVTDSLDANAVSVPLSGTGITGSLGPMVRVGPSGGCVLPSHSQQFKAEVSGTTDQAVSWYVNQTLNGSASVGTISSSGLYTAPSTLATQTIKAYSSSINKSGSTTTQVTSTPSFAIYPNSADVRLGGSQPFEAQICSTPDTETVTWKVDNIVGGSSTVGTITSAGVYTAPPTAGKHTITGTGTAVNKSSSAIVTVFSGITADFGLRANTAYPIPANMLGYGRAESMHSTTDRRLITQAGVTVARLYAQIPLVYATQTPDWTKVDWLIASVRDAGQKVMLQVSYSPPWLQSSCGYSGNPAAAPTDVNKWGQIAASYVAHMDAVFPGVVEDYEIWNEPNTSALCTSDHLTMYQSIYAATAPLMKQQAAMDGSTIRVGGPVTSGNSGTWISALLTNSATAPYVDFISYHEYLFGPSGQVSKWDTYDVSESVYQKTQDPYTGVAASYKYVRSVINSAAPSTGFKLPVYITEFNTNYTFLEDCCKNDPVYAPVWNALYFSDLLNTVYSGIPMPRKLVYFAGSAYPYFCLIGVRDTYMDCLYSGGSTPVPYPQYYAFQLMASSQYFNLASGGFMAKSVLPPAGAGGIVVTAFYNSTQDGLLIVNPTSTAYTQMPVTLANTGYSSPQATLFKIANGASITSSQIGINNALGGTYTTSLDVPPYSVQAISLKP